MSEKVELLLQDEPTNLRHWLRLADLTESPDEKNVVLERSLKSLPFSYKLWNLYLQVRCQQVAHLEPSHPAVSAVSDVFQRSTEALPMMPRLWLAWASFELDYRCDFVQAASVLISSLQTLPVQQHRKIWNDGLRPLAAHPYCPSTVSTAIMEAYLRFRRSASGFLAYLAEMETSERAFSWDTLLRVIDEVSRTLPSLQTSEQFWRQCCNVASRLMQLLSIPAPQALHDAFTGSETLCPEAGRRLKVTRAKLLAHAGRFCEAIDCLDQLIGSSQDASVFQDVFLLRQTLELELLKNPTSVARNPQACGLSSTTDPIVSLIQRARGLESSYEHRFIQALLLSDPSNTELWLKRIEMSAPEEVRVSFRQAMNAVSPADQWKLVVALANAERKIGGPTSSKSVLIDAIQTSATSSGGKLMEYVLSKYPQDQERLVSSASGANQALCVRQGFLAGDDESLQHLIRNLTSVPVISLFQVIGRWSAPVAEKLSILQSIWKESSQRSVKILTWLEFGRLLAGLSAQKRSAAIVETNRELLSTWFESLITKTSSSAELRALFEARAEIEVFLGSPSEAATSVERGLFFLLDRIKEALHRKTLFQKDSYTAMMDFLQSESIEDSSRKLDVLVPRPKVIAFSHRVLQFLLDILQLLLAIPADPDQKELVVDALKELRRCVLSCSAAICDSFAQLGEIQQSRDLFRAIAPATVLPRAADAAVDAFWAKWKSFEAAYGTSDLFDDLKRRQRAIEST